jgi:hypothetical protein
MTSRIGDAVKAAIQDGVSVVEWLLAFGNMDDQIGSGVFRFSHGTLEASAGTPIPFGRRWDNDGDWELFGHIKATPIRRPESKCCDDLKRKIKELERTLAEHGKRLVRIEANLGAQAKGFESATVRAKATAKPMKRG